MLNRLNELAPAYEKCLWKYEQVKDHITKPESDNLEDIHGYYECLGNGSPLSIVSSYKSIDKCYRVRKGDYHQKSR